MSGHIDVRLMQPDEARASADASRIALLMPTTSDESWEKVRGAWEADYVAASAWDGDRAVGHVGSIDFLMALPGGTRVPAAGVTRVGVLPTHTRRGLLTRMMHEVLREEHRRGKALAALLASEVMIYPRFGFGLATEEHRLLIDVPRLGNIRGGADGSFRLVPRAEVLATVTDIYHRLVDRPGSIVRIPWLTARYFEDAVADDKAEHIVVHTSPDGIDDGYAQYALKWHDTDGVDRLGECEVKEVVGATPAVELALWQYLSRISLVRQITFDRAPKDHVLRLAAHDSRAVRVLGQWDELFVRPLHVEACLAQRSYGDLAGSVALRIDDPLFPDNNGVWSISAAGSRRTDAAAEVTATINALGSTLLGGMTWTDEAAIGRASGDPGALRRLDALFRHHPLPFCGSFF